MQGINFSFSDETQQLSLKIIVSELSQPADVDAIVGYLKKTKYKAYFVFEDKLKECVGKANIDFASKVPSSPEAVIGEALDAAFDVVLSQDKMLADLVITAPYGGKFPTVAEIANICKDKGVYRGLSKKRISEAAAQAKQLLPGDKMSFVIAKGLPAKDGRATTLKQLVPNIADRILKPKINDKDIADMRDLGDIVCVQVGTPIAKILPETKGRDGFTVEGKVIKAKPGKKQNFKLEANVVTAPDDDLLLVAEKTGMPSFSGTKVKIDDVYSSRGVNVGTGNINYGGAVVINGDVADKMRIVAKGDITINGFVESAYIETTGSVVITQGAAGQNTNPDLPPNCIIKAKSNILIANAQGCDITCGGNLHVQKQLAFSHIHCAGSIFLGRSPEKADGTIMGCKISVRGDINAGVIGAQSGAKMFVDFSNEINKLTASYDELVKAQQSIHTKFNEHTQLLISLKSRNTPQDMSAKINLVEKAVIKEKRLLNWIEHKIQEVEAVHDLLPKYMRLKALHTLHSGVRVKYNHKTWESDYEHGPTQVSFKKEQWNVDPLVSN